MLGTSMPQKSLDVDIRRKNTLRKKIHRHMPEIIIYSIVGIIIAITVYLALQKPADATTPKMLGQKYEQAIVAKPALTTTTTAPKPITIEAPSSVVADAPLPKSTSRIAYAPGTVEQIIAQYFPENPAFWIEVARCESGLDPNKNNYQGSGASGLFQVMMPMHDDMVLPGESIYDPYVNTRIARSLSRNGTQMGAWEESRSCWG